MQDGLSFVEEERRQGWHTDIAKFETRLLHAAQGLAVALTAEYQGRPAGYVSLYFRARHGAFADGGVPEIVDLAVLEKYRGRGVATRLMDAAERLAGERSDRVSLAVGLHSGYGAAQRMYILRGYVPDGSGAWYGDAPCPQYAECRNDDDFVLYMSKKL